MRWFLVLVLVLMAGSAWAVNYPSTDFGLAYFTAVEAQPRSFVLSNLPVLEDVVTAVPDTVDVTGMSRVDILPVGGSSAQYHFEKTGYGDTLILLIFTDLGTTTSNIVTGY